MPNTFILIFICVLAISPCHSTSITEVASSLWRKFWSSSCEFSSDVSRSKRSLNLPNVQDPDEFFDYLYPSLHLKPEDVVSGRSLYFPSWLDDIVEYWETECYSNSASSRSDEDAIVEPEPTDQRLREDQKNTTSSKSPKVNATQGAKAGENLTGNLTAMATKQTSFPQGPVVSFLEAIFPPLKLLDIQPVNKFYAQYGGDVEYFFPIWGFGIPFDGEITFLGFHGFKGLFPYRR